MIAKSRGSNSLAGAGPFGFRVPAVAMLPPCGYSSMGRATALEAVCNGFESHYPTRRLPEKQRLLNQ